MRRIHSRSPFLLVMAVPGVLWLGGCVEPTKGGPAQMSEEDDDDDPGATSSIGGDTGDMPEPPPPDTDGDTDGDTESDTGDATFIVPPDGPAPTCDIWAQDCPAGEKCMPWANDGGVVWNDLKCVEIAPDPGQPGDPCQVEGSGVSGIDTCDLASMCWGVDGETNTGTCVAMCTGDQGAPVCDDPSTSCVIVNDGVLTLCLPDCDPLLQDCAAGEACYPVQGIFTCAPDASGPELGLFGDPCEAINTCDAGLFCANADVVPDCQGSLGCCSDFCDLAAPDPNDECTGAAGGQECVAWYPEGEVPPGAESIGACAIPTS